MADPKRGEVWLVDLGMAAKVRPCLIMNIPTHENERVLFTVIAHTTSPRKTRFEVKTKVGFLREGVFDAQNIITIPKARLIRKIGVLPELYFNNVEDSVCLWLGFNTKNT